MAAPHTPITDLHQTRIECPGCGWRQLLDEDLHEGYTESLIAWHQAHPAQDIDHLAVTEGLQGGLGIAEYVRWTDDGLGCLAVGDERTGQAGHFNHECLAVMESVHFTSGLTQAVQRTRRRLDYSRSQATTTVVDLALTLYRKGLLVPAPSASDQPRT
ncbi:hypothetical protein [Nocardiopsis alborubida]|uniref:Uncharacterized protein n=1 Tax=Nocardiopsis alborubida TaxID=146802 RepID=A0A7X6M8S3_9ACTN|nr:hypothetical protein [Nocardiopsis alborubida]NKY96681.1 hypothetical protein [Nocardiopsis alborubida]